MVSARSIRAALSHRANDRTPKNDANPRACWGPRMARKTAYKQSALCCCCSRPASGRRLRRCAVCNVFFCGRRSCRAFHAAWCSAYALRNPQPSRDHHGRHPSTSKRAVTASPLSTPVQSPSSTDTAQLEGPADSLATALLKPAKLQRQRESELLQVRHAWLFPPSRRS